MKTKLAILAALALSSVAVQSNAADTGLKQIYNGKGQLIAVVRVDAKQHESAKLASTGYCSTCCTKKSR